MLSAIFGQTNYSSSKSPLQGLRVNVIFPGYIETVMTAKRLRQPNEIAKAVEFILDNEYMCDADIHANDGFF